ncbi:riboflavin synthase [Henriciella sp.]|uniref:riboflavin synthase n=1 Tax=Henriciella sp. TaxID=1968823 RepID=UPI0026316DFD|nr:riboflavin synthase [Henriciella sp.]
MFTGLITDIGKIQSVEDAKGLRRFRVQASYDPAEIETGDSVMHSGVCLTVVDYGSWEGGCWMDVEAVPETLSRSTLGDLVVGAQVNLEQSLCLGDKLGGHFVFGHVDGLGEVVAIRDEGDSHRVTVRPPEDIARYFATKGSAAIDGVSLTVALAHDNGDFDVAIIPHTWNVTTLGQLQVGSKVNLEVDMLARYVGRMIGTDMPQPEVTE